MFEPSAAVRFVADSPLEPDFSRGGLNRLSGPLGPGNWITSTPILTRTSRAVYAKGAVRAARWVVERPPGVYGIREVLGL